VHAVSWGWLGLLRYLTVIIECVRIEVRAGKREEARRILSAWAGPTEVEPGCISCRILQEAIEPFAFCCELRWKSHDDLVRHLRSERYKALLVLIDQGVGPPVIEFHRVTETEGFDLVERVRNVA
jgi:quinol monooxygenase YgiN